MNSALIISDGKAGHVNQSIALCRHLGLEYESMEVSYKDRAAKALSYLFDHLGIYTDCLLAHKPEQPGPGCKLLVSTGSTTYYASKLLARRSGIPNAAILYPKGYRLDFDYILCPAYDHPPKRDHVIELPINLCAADADFFHQKALEFRQLHQKQKPAAGIILGGPNAVSTLDPERVSMQLEQMFTLTDGMERWVTTSRRTPPEVEAVAAAMPFDYMLINSRDSFNPIPAFIQLCDRLFVTSDSASMISECVSFGTAKVEILMNRQLKTPNKFEELICGLEHRNAVHVFDGSLGNADAKIDLKPLLSAIDIS